MFTTIFILAVNMLVRKTSCQWPSYTPFYSLSSSYSGNKWPSSIFPISDFSSQPYTNVVSVPFWSAGTYQRPSLSPTSDLSRYRGISTGVLQSNSWNVYNPIWPQSYSLQQPIRSIIAPPHRTQFAGYSRPITQLSPISIPTQSRAEPFRSFLTINHQASSPPQPKLSHQAQPQSNDANIPIPSPPASPQTTPTHTQPAIPTRTLSWSNRISKTLAIATPPQPAPVPPSNQSAKISQNNKVAQVHYMNIGPQLHGDYKFGYHTGEGGSYREEARLADGSVQGSYGYIDGDGKPRVVRYTAGKHGFQVEGEDPKGSSASESGSPVKQLTPIKIDEGAAFRSFTQGK